MEVRPAPGSRALAGLYDIANAWRCGWAGFVGFAVWIEVGRADGLAELMVEYVRTNDAPEMRFMQTDELLHHLRRQPFRRFRVVLTDGRSLEVRHPELAIIGRSTVSIALIQPRDPELTHDRLVTFPLAEILRIEPVEAPAAPFTSGA